MEGGNNHDFVSIYKRSGYYELEDTNADSANRITAVCEQEYQGCPAGWDMYAIGNKNKCLKNVGISSAKEALTLCQNLNAVLPVAQTKGCF